MVVSMESINVLPVSERWHPHLYALGAVDTGIPGLGYAMFFVFGSATFRFSPRGCAELVGRYFGPVPLEQLGIFTPTSTAIFCF